ncbi:hypothetical protein I6F40_02895 [Pseudoalteromonas sp. SWXJ133]|uniref:hypothetical protein n=1 Tax=unclassified Pseudoalteromonas TaxID=194690 RepID=UPI0014072F74|nr:MULTISPECIES: hypothetical protein [unclassified Pseudoalteromonas]MBH0019321.1 hypothetical protein [Pseudoalteromonas sp. SWXJ133]
MKFEMSDGTAAQLIRPTQIRKAKGAFQHHLQILSRYTLLSINSLSKLLPAYKLAYNARIPAAFFSR